MISLTRSGRLLNNQIQHKDAIYEEAFDNAMESIDGTVSGNVTRQNREEDVML